MTNTTPLPPQKKELLDAVVGELSRVPGVRAVVLGGSYARGTQHDASDLDIGLYYNEASPFSLAQIRQIAEAIAAEPPVVTGFYEWGPWVNGGAWIRTTAGKVDFLYRNLEQVERTIAEAREGIVHHDYGQQPAYGFYSVIYLAEIDICLPLADPDGVIAGLKRQVAVYPPRLKERLVGDTLWSAEFSLLHARAFAAAGDVYNTAGCLTRVAANLTQALFALNERYFIGDKRALETIAAFPLVPPGYPERLAAILAHPGATPAELAHAVSRLRALWSDVVALTGGEYRAQFQIPSGRE